MKGFQDEEGAHATVKNARRIHERCGEKVKASKQDLDRRVRKNKIQGSLGVQSQREARPGKVGGIEASQQILPAPTRR